MHDKCQDIVSDLYTQRFQRSRKPRYLRTRLRAERTPTDRGGQGQHRNGDGQPWSRTTYSPARSLHTPVPDQFKELYDLHLNELYSRSDVFKVLRDTRKRLNDPGEFQMAEAEILVWAETGTAYENSEQG